MHYQSMCGYGYCGPMGFKQEDQAAILKEQEKILEAKLATIRHMIEQAEKTPVK